MPRPSSLTSFLFRRATFVVLIDAASLLQQEAFRAGEKSKTSRIQL
jgi:hypothetical protein